MTSCNKTNARRGASTNQSVISNTSSSAGYVNIQMEPNPSALDLYSFTIYAEYTEMWVIVSQLKTKLIAKERHLKAPRHMQMVIRPNGRTCCQIADRCVDRKTSRKWQVYGEKRGAWNGNQGSCFEFRNHLDVLCGFPASIRWESLCLWLIGKYFR